MTRLSARTSILLTLLALAALSGTAGTMNVRPWSPVGDFRAATIVKAGVTKPLRNYSEVGERTYGPADSEKTGSPAFTLLSSGTANAATRDFNRSLECRYASSDHHAGWSVREIDHTISCAVRHFPVQGGVAAANCVAEHESGDRYLAVGSGNYGVYQFAPATFRSVWSAHHKLERRWGLKDSVFNGRSNVVLAIFTVHSVGAWRTTWTHPECGV